MKILIVHNTYKQHDRKERVLYAECDLLLSHGHEIVLSEKDRAAIDRISFPERITLSLNAIWSQRSYREILEGYPALATGPRLFTDHHPR